MDPQSSNQPNPTTEADPTPNPEQSVPPTPESQPGTSVVAPSSLTVKTTTPWKKILIAILVLALAAGAAWYFLIHQKKTTSNVSAPKKTAKVVKKSSIDLTKLPLGDGKYSQTAKVGYVMTCQSSFNGGGAYKAGPWIDQTGKTWDATKKVAVSGNVSWPTASEKISADGTTRTISTNALPNHSTGVFPIQSSDPAYQYDRNPNSIKPNSLTFSLPINPTVQTTPQCIFGEVGITLSGAVLFDALDAGGRDAVAWELQDDCSGHPNSIYHYHGYSSCIPDKSGSGEHSDLIGYAFDGFGIFGTKGENGEELSSADLDECHGHTHEIIWNGQKIKMYHYHLTRDFPYSVSCFKGQRTVSGPLVKEGSQTGQPSPPAGNNQQAPPPGKYPL